MEKKETVILYRGQIESLLSLNSLKDVKTILRAIVLYGMDNETPEIPEHLTFGWLWFKNTIDSHREQYAARCDKNRTNAKKRWDNGESMPPDANGCDGIRSDANDADKDKDKDKDLKRECVSRTCALDAERIAGIYPRAKIGNWQNVILSIIAAIQREFDRGSSVSDAVALVELGTMAYAEESANIPKRYIYQAVKFFDEGIYNYDPEVWQQGSEVGKAKEVGKTGKKYDWRDPSTWDSQEENEGENDLD